MDKNERTHGEQMATYGELNGLYTTIIDLQRRIKILEAIRQKDEKQKERVNEAR
jgi:hypothetical protein